MMRLLDKLERKYGRLALPHVTLAIIAGQVLCYFLTAGNPDFIHALRLVPSRIMEGELWRLITFVVEPPIAHPIFAIFGWYLFYLMGTALENRWGVFQYNAFLLVGYIAAIAVSFLTPEQPSSHMFIGTTVFLAFAHLYPDFQILLFFIIPVKIKWLALLTWAGYCALILMGSWTIRLLILASISNFLLFFGRDILLTMRAGKRQMEAQTREIVEEDKPLHECTVCGVTDKSDTAIEFRYCTTCEPTSCYCSEHMKDHDHRG